MKKTKKQKKYPLKKDIIYATRNEIEKLHTELNIVPFVFTDHLAGKEWNYGE